MGLNIEIIKKEDQITSKWSGGTTTQLIIYPKDASYSARNFMWRISSAEVELPESEFTHLPGIKRIILPITGELHLEHEGHYNKFLKPFEQDCFSGDWTTKSCGRVTDFNLMMKDCYGKVGIITIPAGSSKNIIPEQFKEGVDYVTDILYVLGENSVITFNKKNINLENKELISVTRSNIKDDYTISVKNGSKKQTEIIMTNIFY